jgi:hypothetical protein
MKIAKIHIVLIIFLLLFPYSLSAKNYYISATGNDNNNGSIENPWLSLEKVSAALAGDGFIQAGDSILFKSGDTFLGRLVCYRSGNAGNPIVISSYGEGEKPILTGSGNIVSGDNIEVIKLINTSHIVVDGLWLKNDRKIIGDITWGTNSSQGIKVEAKKWGGVIRDLTFINLKFTDIFGVDMIDWLGNFTDGIGAHGIWLDSEKNDLESNPVKVVGIEDVLIENCEFYNIGNRGISVRKLGNVRNNPVHEEERVKNIIIRNNNFERLGGDGIVLASVCYALIENNEFTDMGWGDRNSFTDRYRAYGEGCWIWDTRFLVFQYNRQYRANGKGDTYASHIDFFCQHVIFQYNYSEDTEGGFCEILGDCKNITWRYNVSVNDGFRETGHNRYSIWLSGYVGKDQAPVPSDNCYVYNNTIYLDKSVCKPDISIFAKNTYIYNNIFQASGGAQIGAGEVDIDIQPGGELVVSNNLFYGDIANDFTKLDDNKIFGQDPQFVNPLSENGSMDGFNIQQGSPAIDAGIAFAEPAFSKAGIGIFEDISPKATQDAFSNEVDLLNIIPNIGASDAFNGNLSTILNPLAQDEKFFTVVSNPVTDLLRLKLEEPTNNSVITVFNVKGEELYVSSNHAGDHEILVQVPARAKNGIYFIRLKQEQREQYARFILYR